MDGNGALNFNRSDMARDDVWYVYGIVKNGFDASQAPAGLEDARIDVVSLGTLAALASRVPASVYGGDVLDQHTGDVAWLSPRAMSHDRVLTWAQDHGGVVPMPMFSLWRSDTALTKALTQRGKALASVFKRVEGADEFGLRIYRRDDAMLATIHEHDAEMGRLRATLQNASPGQRYLLERKYAEEAKRAARIGSMKAAKEVFASLKKLSRSALARPLAPEKDKATDTTLVLNGAFLVDRARANAFREGVGAIVREYQPRGLSFDFTGPWPPYNFVTEKRSAPKRPTRSKRKKR